MTSPPLLDVRDLTLAYGRQAAVRNVNLSVGPGELVALLGVNGSGKTTLLRGIMGLVKVVRGSVRVMEDDITSLATEKRVRKGVVLVPEGRGVLAEMTVGENLALGALIGRNRRTGGIQYEDVFERFPILEQRLAQQAGTLSGGEQQMLVIARALLSEPTVLLLDEPSFGLSPQMIERVFAAVTALKESGLTILMSEQNATQALEVADRVYVMDHGEVSVEGSATELAMDGTLEDIYIGTRVAKSV